MVTEYRKRRAQFVAGLNQIPGFRCQTPDGAFYAWVNIEDTGLSAEEVQKFLLEEAGVAGISPAAVGSGGQQYHPIFLLHAPEAFSKNLEQKHPPSVPLRAPGSPGCCPSPPNTRSSAAS